MEREERADALGYRGLFVVRRDHNRDVRGVVRGEELGEAGEGLAPDVIGYLCEGHEVQDQVHDVDGEEVAQDEVVDGEY